MNEYEKRQRDIKHDPFWSWMRECIMAGLGVPEYASLTPDGPVYHVAVRGNRFFCSRWITWRLAELIVADADTKLYPHIKDFDLTKPRARV